MKAVLQCFEALEEGDTSDYLQQTLLRLYYAS
jgi:hypothetical protein